MRSPSSSEKDLPSSVSEEVPSIPPKARGKADKPKLLTSPFTRCRWGTLVQTVQRFCHGGRWASEVTSPQVQLELGSCLNFFLVVRVMIVHPFVFGSFISRSLDAWQMACQSSSTSGGLHRLSLTFEVSMKVRNTPSSCARMVSSSAPSG